MEATLSPGERELSGAGAETPTIIVGAGDGSPAASGGPASIADPDAGFVLVAPQALIKSGRAPLSAFQALLPRSLRYAKANLGLEVRALRRLRAR
jgi:hypothetical protein